MKNDKRCIAAQCTVMMLRCKLQFTKSICTTRIKQTQRWTHKKSSSSWIARDKIMSTAINYSFCVGHTDRCNIYLLSCYGNGDELLASCSSCRAMMWQTALQIRKVLSSHGKWQCTNSQSCEPTFFVLFLFLLLFKMCICGTLGWVIVCWFYFRVAFVVTGQSHWRKHVVVRGDNQANVPWFCSTFLFIQF